MRIALTFFVVLGLLAVLIDAFETILQPRRVTHRFRIARMYFRFSWALWRLGGIRIPPGRKREAFLSAFGPLSMCGLFVLWVFVLIVGFACLYWVTHVAVNPPNPTSTLWTYLYLSGTTFFTLGYGDITPLTFPGRIFAIIEAGLGFGFLAVMIAYLPVLNQAFSRREVTISLLDARAGSPSSASQMLVRIARSNGQSSMNSVLQEWEVWAAELLESHLSFPVLSFYRSQHDNQSWLSALTTILDTCAILILRGERESLYRAQLTFAMARHAAVDLSLVLKTPPLGHLPQRMSDSQREQLAKDLREASVGGDDALLGERFDAMRAMYEPFVYALAQRFLMTIPPIVADVVSADNWQRSAWMQHPPGIGNLPIADETEPKDGNEHFT